MLRNVFVPIFGKIQGLEFVANVIKMISWTPRTIKLWDFVGYCGIEKAIILIYAFYSTVLYATSKSTSHFRRVMQHISSHNSRASCNTWNNISLDVAFPVE